MKIRNPHHTDPIDTFVSANKAAIDAYLQANADKAFLTPDEIRAAFPAQADKLTDGAIHAVADALGLRVVD